MHAMRAFFIVGNTFAALLIASSCADQPTPLTPVDSRHREASGKARSAPSAGGREHRVNRGIDVIEQVRLDGSVRRTTHLRDWSRNVDIEALNRITDEGLRSITPRTELAKWRIARARELRTAQTPQAVRAALA